MAKRIDGGRVAARVLARVQLNASLLSARGIIPCLAVIMAGDDPASAVYVRKKREACAFVGVTSRLYALPGDTDEASLLALIEKLNADRDVHGILVQLPLPAGLNERRILSSIATAKDVDGFSARLDATADDLLACTPAGVIELLDSERIPIDGSECVIVGRSNIVGKPLMLQLLARNGTVTVCHSHTRNLGEVTRRADILVSAAGVPCLITGDMVKEGAAVIDVGICRGADGKLSGDVDYRSVEPVAAYITPVPGGVGPMTIAMLMKNTIQAAKAASEAARG